LCAAACLQQVINWAFSLLISAVGSAGNPPAASSSNSSNTVLQTANGQALVALTGLLQVLWHHIHVAGIPAGLRDLLLVAMALRNLLLAVALPVWARKAVAAQLRAWQEAISEAQATLPLVVEDDARVVHLLRVLGEVRCQWVYVRAWLLCSVCLLAALVLSSTCQLGARNLSSCQKQALAAFVTQQHALLYIICPMFSTVFAAGGAAVLPRLGAPSAAGSYAATASTRQCSWRPMPAAAAA
jgi:hypothetical protein